MTCRAIATKRDATIKIVGVGGGGVRVVNLMKNNLLGVEFIAISADEQDLEQSNADHCIQIELQFKGHGSVVDFALASQAIQGSLKEIIKRLAGSDKVFVIAGMGGFTGTGISPVIAELSKEQGAFTIGVVTMPFMFEGKQSKKNAELGWNELQKHTDIITTIDNNSILASSPEMIKLTDMLKLAHKEICEKVYKIIRSR